jgi:hypothetical protein
MRTLIVLGLSIAVGAAAPASPRPAAVLHPAPPPHAAPRGADWHGGHEEGRHGGAWRWHDGGWHWEVPGAVLGLGVLGALAYPYGYNPCATPYPPPACFPPPAPVYVAPPPVYAAPPPVYAPPPARYAPAPYYPTQ